MYNSWYDWAETLIPSNTPLREFYKIGEVSELLNLKSYVLRYWETEFSILTPQKTEGNQRLYRRKDLAASFLIKHLLYVEKFSIEGARNKIRNLRMERDVDLTSKKSENEIINRSESEQKDNFNQVVKSNDISQFQNDLVSQTSFQSEVIRLPPSPQIPKEKIKNIIDEMLQNLQSL